MIPLPNIPLFDRTSITLPSTSLGHTSCTCTCSKALVMLHPQVVNTKSSRCTPHAGARRSQHPRPSPPRPNTTLHTTPTLSLFCPSTRRFGLWGFDYLAFILCRVFNASCASSPVFQRFSDLLAHSLIELRLHPVSYLYSIGPAKDCELWGYT